MLSTTQFIYHISVTEEKLWAVSIVRMDKSRRTFIVWWGNFLDDHCEGGSKDSVKEMKNRSRSCQWCVFFPVECSSNYEKKIRNPPPVWTGAVATSSVIRCAIISYRSSWLWRGRVWLLFVLCPVLIWAVIPAIITGIVCDFPQPSHPPHAILKQYFKLGQERFFFYTLFI